MSGDTFSQRGFRRAEPIVCSYGSEVLVYESSAASAPHLWLSIDQNPMVLRGARPGRAVAHLTLDQVDALIETLTRLRDAHYQNEPSP